jgi:hypothetical protein
VRTGYRQDRDPSDGDLDRYPDTLPNCDIYFDAYRNIFRNTNAADTSFYYTTSGKGA